MAKDRYQSTVQGIIVIALALCCLLFGSLHAIAEPIRLDGITFSEGSANVRLMGVSGSGTLNDPFIVIEEIFDEGEAVLAVDVWSNNFGSRIATMHATGFAITKVVINKTKRTWDYFGVELEFVHGIGSDYYDGLSFAQSAIANRPFRADRFKNVEDLIEPRDIVRFTNGAMRDNEEGRFTFSVTYTGHTPKFLIVQHVRRPYAGFQKPSEYANVTR
jgi:hypothetical protein